MFEIKEETSNSITKTVADGAKIIVIGVGGGGCNAVNTMIKSGLTGVEYVVANTDSQALNVNLAATKIQLGMEITKGLGAGANPEIGRKAALDEYERLSEILQDADMVFITAGMGGGTGTGAAPVIAKLCKELGALTVGVVTKPFLFEGKKRFRQADQGIITLEECVDSLITIPNQRLLYIAGESLSLIDTFKKADEVLLNAVRGISDLINTTGHINADFADVSTVMANKGLSLMGTGVCSGPDRAIKAANEAISSPLLEDISIDGATGIIINITGDESLTMHEVNEAVTLIMEAADEDAEIIFGSVIDENMNEDIKVTVVATGLGGQDRVTTSSVKQQRQEQVIPQATDEIRVDIPTQNIQPQAPTQQHHVDELTVENIHQERISEPLQEQYSHEAPSLEDKKSSLAQSIQEAATRYQTPGNQISEERREAPAQRETVNPSQRAKSIAEKLGFMNFDEEELDMPSYLRKEDNVQKNPEQNLL